MRHLCLASVSLFLCGVLSVKGVPRNLVRGLWPLAEWTELADSRGDRIGQQPIAELDSAIRQLGGADFERPIRVSGPADLQHLGERLDWLRRRLTELEAQKNRFLRHLSHDLKTPLAALREGTELLNDQVAGPLAPP